MHVDCVLIEFKPVIYTLNNTTDVKKNSSSKASNAAKMSS